MGPEPRLNLLWVLGNAALQLGCDWNVFLIITGWQAKRSVLPISGLPILFRLLDPVARRGDEVPPDIAPFIHRCSAKSHEARSAFSGLHTDLVAGAEHHHTTRFKHITRNLH